MLQLDQMEPGSSVTHKNTNLRYEIVDVGDDEVLLSPENSEMQDLVVPLHVFQQEFALTGAFRTPRGRSRRRGDRQDERDPLLGTRSALSNQAPTDRFRRPDASGPTRTTSAIPQFITVKGGGYFFMPGLRALKFLANPTTDQDGQSS